MNRPKILNFSVTYFCNIKCPFCWQNKLREAKFIDFKKYQKVLDDASECSIQNVNFWGGEPLSHPQIFDMIKEVKKRRMRSYMVTNGLLLEKFAEKIIESKLDFLQISIDAPGNKHDEMRNTPGLYSRIEAGVKKVESLKRIFPIVSSCATIMPQNIDELSAIAYHNLSIGIKAGFYQFVMTFPKETIEKYKQRLVNDYGFEYDKINIIDNFEGSGLSKEEFEKASEQMNTLKEKYGNKIAFPNILLDAADYDYYTQTDGEFPSHKTPGCWNIDNRMNIQSNGDVVLCPDFPDYVIGNVFEQSIMDIWNSPKRKKFIDDFYNGKPFPICYRCCQLWERDATGGNAIYLHGMERPTMKGIEDNYS